jgi:hypothetical protein
LNIVPLVQREQPLVQKKLVIACIRSLSLEGVDANENPRAFSAILWRVSDRQAGADGVRSGCGFMDV